ncbi:hypothetical protein SAMN05421869_14424 [Nonomuraea jiangxiensis]|uniref:DUF4276 family protein n=2 Tax=Nonomuraea jiangxiensis TaxID=633440 RepID=A0A1G9TBE3_9ACTN|nr:hypothetical protein SAMN05421869_14424 [Nonomuraea jiangxiensis]
MRVLLEQWCPDMRGRIVEINDKPTLHAASSGTLAARAETLASKIRARAVLEEAEVACVFVHEDLDGVDSDRHPVIQERVEKALAAAMRTGTAHYVLAVAEIEAWLLLFPEALSAFAASWSVPAKFRGKDTGRVVDPKKVLKTEVSAGRYRESDAPLILEKAADLGLVVRPVGHNRSYALFRSGAVECCANHLAGGAAKARRRPS